MKDLPPSFEKPGAFAAFAEDVARDVDRRVLAMSNAIAAQKSEPLTLSKLREALNKLEYALLIGSPGVKGTDCLKMERNEFMPPGCRYVLVVAPDKLQAVAYRLNARASTRLGHLGAGVYEFFLPPR